MRTKLKDKIIAVVFIIMVIVCVCIIEIIKDYISNKRLEELRDDSKYTTIIELDKNKGCMKYNNNTKEVYIVYTAQGNRDIDYIRIKTYYVYDENTKNLIYKEEETDGN